jgi:hypothetical protein
LGTGGDAKRGHLASVAGIVKVPRDRWPAHAAFAAFRCRAHGVAAARRHACVGFAL